jgi:hypothetical protein
MMEGIALGEMGSDIPMEYGLISGHTKSEFLEELNLFESKGEGVVFIDTFKVIVLPGGQSEYIVAVLKPKESQ